MLHMGHTHKSITQENGCLVFVQFLLVYEYIRARAVASASQTTTLCYAKLIYSYLLFRIFVGPERQNFYWCSHLQLYHFKP